MKKVNKNIPNILSMVRIALVPVMMIVYSIGYLSTSPLLNLKSMLENNPNYSGIFAHLSVANFILLILALIGAITDLLDGMIARRYNLITDLGKFLDPLADKLMNLTLFIIIFDQSCRLQNDLFTWWMLVVIVAREFAVTGLRLIAVSKNKVIAASPYGKFKTVSQIVVIVVLLLGVATFNNPVSTGMIGYNSAYIIITKILEVIMLVLTVFSGIDYFIRNKDCLKEEKNKKHKGE